MDLAKFAAMPREKGFLKFTQNDNVKVIRFLYGAVVGVDEELGIPVRYQEFDQASKTVVYDTPNSKPTMSLKVAVYTSKNEFTVMTWNRRADTFGADILLPLWESAGGRICDTVYKVTCTQPGTLNAKFSFFPLKDSATYAMPDLNAAAVAEVAQPAAPSAPVASQPTAPVQQSFPTQPASAPAPTQAAAQPAQKSKRYFWEE